MADRVTRTADKKKKKNQINIAKIYINMTIYMLGEIEKTPIYVLTDYITNQ